jgi:hypothetical protein
MKSPYFIPYSLLSWCIGLRQLYWLDYYYTGICLLLCWQYYRFSRACGLSDRASMVFVIIQSLLFGNNIFSFYRYYGISSSIFAQIVSVGLVRQTIILAKLLPRSFAQKPRHANLPLAGESASSTTLKIFALAVILIFSHIGGLAIAACGVIAVIGWAGWQYGRRWFFAAIASIFLLNVGYVIFITPAPAVLHATQLGWLTSWQAFDIFHPTSPALDRAMQVLTSAGSINIIVGLGLIFIGDIAGWITVVPLLLLSMPIVVVPFVTQICGNEVERIVTFQRLLFATAAPLAAVSAGSLLFSKPLPFLLKGRFSLFLVAAAMLSPDLTAGRTWQIAAIVPNDLTLLRAVQKLHPPETSKMLPAIAYALSACGQSIGPTGYRWPSGPSIYGITPVYKEVHEQHAGYYSPIAYRDMISFHSIAAFYSLHWSRQQSATDTTGGSFEIGFADGKAENRAHLPQASSWLRSQTPIQGLQEP